jgi:hypothetical protein
MSARSADEVSTSQNFTGAHRERYLRANKAVVAPPGSAPLATSSYRNQELLPTR